MRKENKNKFCPYCGKRLAREDPPLRKLDGDLSGLLTPDKPFMPPSAIKTIEEMNADTARAISEDPREYIDEKNKQLGKEVEWIVEGAISKVIEASLASGVPCDPDTSDGIKYIESCLEKMKNE